MVNNIPDKEYLRKRLGELELGDHLCCIYRSAEEQLSAVIPFMQAGLENNEKCLYIIDESSKSEIIDAFKKSNIKIEELIRSGKFELLTKEDAYLKEGSFDPDRMIELLKQKEKEALKEGFRGLRVTGEMTWVFTKAPGVEKLIEYESKLNYFLPASKCVAVCQYHESKFKAEVLLDIIHTHPNVIIYGRLCFNPYFIPPEEFLVRMKGEMGAEVSKNIYERTVKDLIERETLEHERKQAEEKFNKAFNLSPSAVFITTLKEDRFIEMNQSGLSIIGYKLDEVVGHTIKELGLWVDPNDRVTLLGRLQKEDIVRNMETSLRKKSGEVFYAIFSSTIIDIAGQQFLLSTLTDITERKRMESEINISEARYKTLFDSSIDVLVQIDTTGTIVDLNKQAENLSGYKRDEIVGKKISALAGKFTAQSLALMVANFAKRKLGIQVGAYEVESIGNAGQRLFFDINAVPLKDSAGKDTGELAILHDITERKRAADELVSKVKELEKMTKVMVGREDKILELKKKIEELEKTKDQNGAI